VGEVPEGAKSQIIDLAGPLHFLEWPGPEERTFAVVHGLGGSAISWMGVAGGLSAHGRVVAVDLPGFGRSPLAGRNPAVEDNRRLLSRFLREVGSGRIVLCGASMGSTLSLLQAAFEPGSVDALVLSAPALPYRITRPPSALVVTAFSLYRVPRIGEFVVRQRLNRLSPEAQVDIAFRVMAGDRRKVPRELREATIEAVREHVGDPDSVRAFTLAARSLVRLLGRRDRMRRAMDAIECPVLILHGRRDRLVPPGYVSAVVSERPGWRLRIFPDLGHIPYIEAPDRWLAAVESFLEDFGLVSLNA
jgi:pimeloyl-ACP methyl ester carboxylesterase